MSFAPPRYRTSITDRLQRKARSSKMTVVNKIALILAIVGALNWGLVGLFTFDLVAWICGGAGTVVARIIYTLIALAGIWCISLLFMNEDEVAHTRTGA